MKTKFMPKVEAVFFQGLSSSLILFSLLFFMLLLPHAWGNFWLISRLLLIYAVVIAACIQIFIKKDNFVFNKIDVLFLAFISWNFMSYFWATNPSLIWQKSFAWLFLYCLYKTASSIDFRRINLNIGASALCLTLLVNNLTLAWFYFEICNQGTTFGFYYADIAQIQQYLGASANDIGCLLAMTFPFYLLLWHYRAKWRVLIMILAFFHVFFLLGLNCRGALMAVIVQVLVWGSINVKKIRQLIWLIPLGLVLLVGVTFFVQDKQNFLKKYNPLQGISSDHDERLMMWESSIKVWQENIWLGKGARNWMIESPKYPSNLLFGYDAGAYYQHPHNIFFHLLSELGLIGLLGYLGLIFYFLFLYFKKIKLSKEALIYQVLLLVLVGYLVLSSFFGVVYSERFHPIVQQVLLFLSFGIGMGLHQQKAATKTVYTPLKVIILALSAVYLCYFYICIENQKTQNRFMNFKNKGDYEKALNIFETLYDPRFCTIMKQPNSDVALKTQQALIFWKQEKREAAIDAMFEAIKDQPNYHMNWFHFGNMYYGLKDDKNAKICYENVYQLRDNFVKAKIRLVEVHLRQNNIEEAKKWFHLANHQVRNFMQRTRDTAAKNERVKKLPVYKKFKVYEDQLSKLEERLERF